MTALSNLGEVLSYAVNKKPRKRHPQPLAIVAHLISSRFRLGTAHRV